MDDEGVMTGEVVAGEVVAGEVVAGDVAPLPRGACPGSVHC